MRRVLFLALCTLCGSRLLAEHLYGMQDPVSLIRSVNKLAQISPPNTTFPMLKKIISKYNENPTLFGTTKIGFSTASFVGTRYLKNNAIPWLAKKYPDGFAKTIAENRLAQNISLKFPQIWAKQFLKVVKTFYSDAPGAGIKTGMGLAKRFIRGAFKMLRFL